MPTVDWIPLPRGVRPCRRVLMPRPVSLGGEPIGTSIGAARGAILAPSSVASLSRRIPRGIRVFRAVSGSLLAPLKKKRVARVGVGMAVGPPVRTGTAVGRGTPNLAVGAKLGGSA